MVVWMLMEHVINKEAKIAEIKNFEELRNKLCKHSKEVIIFKIYKYSFKFQPHKDVTK